jgi:uncharacterized protein (DUF433 family)
MELVRELYGGEPYEYYPLGEHVVIAPGVCGGRPTFKYTRLEVAGILGLVAAGQSAQEVVSSYPSSRISVEAVEEAITLASQALVQQAKMLRPAV